MLEIRKGDLSFYFKKLFTQQSVYEIMNRYTQASLPEILSRYSQVVIKVYKYFPDLVSKMGNEVGELLRSCRVKRKRGFYSNDQKTVAFLRPGMNGYPCRRQLSKV